MQSDIKKKPRRNSNSGALRIRDDHDMPALKKLVVEDYFDTGFRKINGRSSSFSKEPNLKLNMEQSNSQERAKVSTRVKSPSFEQIVQPEAENDPRVSPSKEEKNTADEDGSKKISDGQPGDILFDGFSDQREEEKEEVKQSDSVHISSSHK